MKLALIAGLALLADTVSAHYIFETLIVGSKKSTKAVRKPAENSPVHDFQSTDVTCNINLSAATETVSVAAGSTIALKLDNGKKIYHPGPAAIYLGRAPQKAKDWDGSGKNWFKIAEWGATFSPFQFESYGMDTFNATIPADIRAGEYLIRAEHIGLHIPGAPEFFVGCAQIKVTGGGTSCPPTVPIPGYISKTDPGITVDIYWPIPTTNATYQVPGPKVYKGGKSTGRFWGLFTNANEVELFP